MVVGVAVPAAVADTQDRPTQERPFLLQSWPVFNRTEMNAAVCQLQLKASVPLEEVLTSKTKRNDFLEKYLVSANEFAAFEFQNPDVESYVQDGYSLEKAIEQTSSCAAFVRYFDRKTGRIRSKLPKTLMAPLASETGSEALDLLHMNCAQESNRTFADFNDSVFEDYANYLENLPRSKINAVISPGDHQNQEDAAYDLAAKWERRLGSKFKPVISEYAFNQSWSQDPSKPVIGRRAAVTYRHAVKNFGSRKSEYEGRLFRVDEIPLEVDGGNLIVGDRHVFVGAKSVDDVMETFHVSRTETQKLMGAIYGKPIVELGIPSSFGGAQNSFHIDLDVAILRDWTQSQHVEVAVLQSPALFAELMIGIRIGDLLKGFPDLDPKAVRRFDEMRSKKSLELYLKDPNPNLEEAMRRGLLKELNLYEIGYEEAKLGFYKHSLEKAGYRVHRIPGNSQTYHRMKLQGSQFTRSPLMPIYSWANVVASGPHLMMPSYHWQAADTYARSVYESLGFKVTEATNSTMTTMSSLGGIRCVSQTFRFGESLVRCD